MSDEKDIYSQLGVSYKKEDVHKAVQSIDKGLFPGANRLIKDYSPEHFVK